MANLYDLIDPVELSAFVTQEATEYELSLDQSLAGFIPLSPIDGIDYRYETDPTESYGMAKYRAFDGEPVPLGRSTMIQLMTGQLPPMGARSMLSEKDRMNRLRVQGTESDFVDAVFVDAAFHARAIIDRIEMQRGEALNTDAVAIAENGLNLDAITFGRPGTNNIVAAVPWSDPTADILSDLTTWLRQYRTEHSGQNPASIVMSDEIWYNMLRNNAIRDLALGAVAAASTGSLVNDDQLRNVLSSYRIPPITTFDRQITTQADDGTVGGSARVLPEEALFFMPADEIGSVLMGEPVIPAQDAGINQATIPNIVVAAWHEPNTHKMWTKSDAIALTVLGRSASVYRCEVL